jgi:hypothetical protein
MVAAPFLSSVNEQLAKAESTPVSTPRRLVAMFTHYGCLTNRWFPKKSHGTLLATDYESTTLKHLAPYAPKLLMPRGIRAMNEWSFEGTYGQTLDPHSQVCGSYFTCHPVTGRTHFDPTATGRSLDHVCAEQMSSSGLPLVLQIGGLANQGTALSFDAPNRVFPGIGSPVPLFTQLTNLFGPGDSSPDTYRFARGKSVIDLVRDDLASLRRVNMSQSDQRKLGDWAELLHQTSGPIAAQCSREAATARGLTEASVAEAAGNSNDIPALASLTMDLVLLSLICDHNRVVVMKFPPSRRFDWLDLSVDSHGLSHRNGSASMGGTCLPGVLEMIARIDDWYAQQFAALVGRLDSVDEGGEKLLDNTATVWFQEMSDGNSHNLNNLPLLQAGSCGGYFKVGQAVNVEDGSANLSGGHSDEDCVDGETPYQQIDAVGTPPDVATQPINKYFCSLMNALGVKAGADGFPLVNGTEVVTRYGMYDDTTLFGTDEPAVIKDPGEYQALRA